MNIFDKLATSKRFYRFLESAYVQTRIKIKGKPNIIAIKAGNLTLYRVNQQELFKQLNNLSLTSLVYALRVMY